MMVGATELFLLLVIVGVFFGAGKLPQVMSALGTGVKQFREASRELDGNLDDPSGAPGPDRGKDSRA